MNKEELKTSSDMLFDDILPRWILKGIRRQQRNEAFEHLCKDLEGYWRDLEQFHYFFAEESGSGLQAAKESIRLIRKEKWLFANITELATFFDENELMKLMESEPKESIKRKVYALLWVEHQIH